jgi:hypothetical protein
VTGVAHIAAISLSVTCNRSVVFSGYFDFLTNKTDRHNITEILLKVALSTISHIKPIAAIVFYFQRESVVEIDQRKTDHFHPFLPELMDKLR